MKLNKPLLSSIAIGIALGAIISCQKNDATSGTSKQDKEKNQKRQPDNCPACGLG
jgi:hypothetical protein